MPSSGNSALFEIIREEITKNDRITFSRFMELCLYHPAFGYYRKGHVPIGRFGDYYTSPTVHKLFGFLVAKQIEEIMAHMDGERMLLVEAGAVRGHLAIDIGEYFKKNNPSFYGRLELIIVEPHKPYRDIQFRETRDFFSKIDFSDTIEELGEINGVFYSNELFDAFPVDIVEFDGESLRQVYVGFFNGKFVEILDNPGEEVKKFIDRFGITFEDRLRTEITLKATEFYGNLVAFLKRGAVLTIDYGYTMEEYLSQKRNRGTLMCYYRHQAHEDPFIKVGEQDITAHVNFSILKRVGEETGLVTAGYTEQQYFLMGCGFVDEVEMLKASLPQDEFEREIQKIKALMLPGGMGTTFKCLLQTKGINKDIFCGFTYRNNKNFL